MATKREDEKTPPGEVKIHKDQIHLYNKGLYAGESGLSESPYNMYERFKAYHQGFRAGVKKRQMRELLLKETKE